MGYADATLEELEAAVPLVRTIVPPTPNKPGRCWPSPIGAFKVRGGIVYLNALKRRDAKLKGVVTATRGNHGQSITLAAARADRVQ